MEAKEVLDKLDSLGHNYNPEKPFSNSGGFGRTFGGND